MVLITNIIIVMCHILYRYIFSTHSSWNVVIILILQAMKLRHENKKKLIFIECQGCPSGSAVKNPLAVQEPQETWVPPLGLEDPLGEGLATDSSILAWRIPRTEEPGGLQSIGSQTVGLHWSNNTHAHWMPTMCQCQKFYFIPKQWPCNIGIMWGDGCVN